MADAGGWAWSDLGVVAAGVSMLSTIGGYLYLHGRQSKASEEIGLRADEAKKKAEGVSDALAAFKVEAVEKFVPRAHLEQMENRLLGRMDQQDSRVEGNFQKLWERIDRAFFHVDQHRKPTGDAS